MNSGLWIAKCNHIRFLVKSVSELFGGDEEAWLTQYTRELIDENRERLDTVVESLESLLKDGELYARQGRVESHPKTAREVLTVG